MNDWAPRLEWKFETSSREDLDRYRHFWGDEYRWTALLPIAWKSIEIKDFAIKPGERTRDDGDWDSRPFALWSMAIHLLVLGMGWNDVGKGLRTWRENGYRDETHPILDFLFRTFGTNIGALEIYYANGNGFMTADAAKRMTVPLYTNRGESLSYEPDSDWSFEPNSELLDRDFYEPLVQGSDSLHLDMHVAHSILGEQIDLDRPWIRRVGEEAEFKFAVNQYAGWALQLARADELEIIGEDGTLLDVEVRVTIQDIGDIGTFYLNKSTGRWFMFSESFGVPSLQWDSHLWGH